MFLPAVSKIKNRHCEAFFAEVPLYESRTERNPKSGTIPGMIHGIASVASLPRNDHLFLRCLLLRIIFFLSVASHFLFSQVYLKKDEALKIYLGEKCERKTVFLTDEQVKSIQQKAKAKVESKIVTYYSSEKGFAFFETRTVRTMPAAFIVVIHPDGSIHALEMLAFYEPEDYLPTKKWMNTFVRKTLNDDLWLKRGVYNISGATLSAQAITESVRKILATYQIAIAKERQ